MKWKNIILNVGIILSFGVCVFSGWKIYDHTSNDQKIRNLNAGLAAYIQTLPEHDFAIDPVTEEVIEVPIYEVDWTSIQQQNPGVVGWLLLNGTDISVPLMQAADNTFYLNHDSTGAWNYLGAIFLDCNVKADFSADNSIIFGHTVAYTGGMLTDLSRFADQNFFDTYKNFWILTPEQNYLCRITNFGIGASGTANYVRDFGSHRDEVLQEWKERSLYVREIEDAQRFVTLSTCRMSNGWFTGDMFTLTAAIQPYQYAIRRTME